MTHATCRLTAKNRDQLRNPTLGNRVWATFTFFTTEHDESLCVTSRQRDSIPCRRSRDSKATWSTWYQPSSQDCVFQRRPPLSGVTKHGRGVWRQWLQITHVFEASVTAYVAGHVNVMRTNPSQREIIRDE